MVIEVRMVITSFRKWYELRRKIKKKKFYMLETFYILTWGMVTWMYIHIHVDKNHQSMYLIAHIIVFLYVY